MNTKNISQKEIEKAKGGDNSAFNDIYNKCKPLLNKIVYKYNIEGYEDKDLFQISCITLMKALKSYDFKSSASFTTYLTQAVKNNLNCVIRKRSKEPFLCSLNSIIEENIELGDVISVGPNLEEEYIKLLEDKRLKAAIKKLPLEQREIVFWYYFKGNTLREYCKIKSIKYEKAKRLKEKALKKLQEQLSL